MKRIILTLSGIVFGIGLYNTGLFIYNDEVLIAGCFLVFCILAYVKGSAVLSSALDERHEKLYTELNLALEGRKNLIVFSISYYEQAERLFNEMEKFITQIQFQFMQYAQSRSLILQMTIIGLVSKKLQMLLTREQIFYQKLQLELGTLLYTRIQNKLNTSETKLPLIDETIVLFEKKQNEKSKAHVRNLVFNLGYFLN